MLANGRDGLKLKMSMKEVITNTFTVDLNMLCSLIEDIIMSNLDDTHYPKKLEWQ